MSPRAGDGESAFESIAAENDVSSVAAGSGQQQQQQQQDFLEDAEGRKGEKEAGTHVSSLSVGGGLSSHPPTLPLVPSTSPTRRRTPDISIVASLDDAQGKLRPWF